MGSNSLCNNAANNSQDNPSLPDGFNGTGWVFSNVQSGLWFDPPFTNAFDYEGQSGTTFDSITLPTGYGSTFDILTGPGFSNLLGTFGAGSSVNFLTLAGGPLSAFRLSGINPAVDAALPNAFPLQIFFNSGANGSFTQTAVSDVPEPSLLVFSFAALGAMCRLRRKR